MKLNIIHWTTGNIAMHSVIVVSIVIEIADFLRPILALEVEALIRSALRRSFRSSHISTALDVDSR